MATLLNLSASPPTTRMPIAAGRASSGARSTSGAAGVGVATTPRSLAGVGADFAAAIGLPDAGGLGGFVEPGVLLEPTASGAASTFDATGPDEPAGRVAVSGGAVEP